MRPLAIRRDLPAFLATCLVLAAASASAAVVTQRLATGLPPSSSAGPLPEAWVAPADEAPEIDGRLDEKAWSKTRPIVLGKLESRGETAPRSEVRFLHKDGVLYVGAQLAEPQVAKLKRAVANPDGPAYQDDSLEIFLSPLPGRDYFQLVVSASGVIFDRQGRDEPAAWNSGAKAAVAVGTSGWSMEIAIPMASLGLDEKIPARWRGNVYRNRQAGGKAESQAWSPTFCGDYDVPSRFGHLLLTPESPWAEQEKTARKQQSIDVKRFDDGSAVLKFDLTSLPKGAKVYRAELLCERTPIDGSYPEAMVAIEIYPLSAPYQQSEGRSAGVLPAAKPLALMAPWFRSFDMTELVQGWMSGKPNHGLYVKTFPGWRVERTCLDLMYEGEPGQAPPQVSQVKAFHRSGQTFLTWKEIADPVGQDEVAWGTMRTILDDLDRQRQVRYCVYRSSSPITAKNLHEARQIAQVEPLSGWNLSGRNKSRPIDRFIATAEVLQWHQWNPFRDAGVEGDYGLDCPIDRFVIAEGRPPLARGTGLYVHTAEKNENACYAVVTCIDGVENTVALGPGNTTAGPVEERVADPQPVLQGELPKMPFFNYKDRRLHYVHWVAAPFSNKPYDYYNWSVGLPEEIADVSVGAAVQPPRQRGPVALELNLHRDGYDYWRTHYRIEPGSIVLCPHDFPLKTWWYGYHEAFGTLRPWTSGVIHNYTEKRLLWFVDWAAKKWPVDRNRVLVTGCRGGASGSGALHLGLRYPKVFNLVIAGHGEPDYSARGEEVQKLWGKVEWGLKTESGGSVWEELNLLRTVESLAPEDDLPLVSMTYAGRQNSAAALAQALIDAGRPVITHTAWGGHCILPVSARATMKCIPLDIRRDRSMLAVNTGGDGGDSIRNGSLLWQSDGMVDEPDKYAVTLQHAAAGFAGTITLRRLQKFRVQLGKTYAWRLEPVDATVRGGEKAPRPSEGVATVGSLGLLTIRDAKMVRGAYRLTITPKGDANAAQFDDDNAAGLEEKSGKEREKGKREEGKVQQEGDH